MAEIELAALGKVCLNRRIPDTETLKHEIAVYAREKNAASAPVQWRFTTSDARTKLKKLYPINSSG